MKVLVTGSSGQLGSYVCELLAGDHDIVGLDIRQQPYKSLQQVSVMGDIRKPEDVRAALGKVDAVVHCAAQVSVEKSHLDPITDAETNVVGTVITLHESSKAGVSRFVYVSSAAVYGNPKYIPIDESHPTSPLSNYGASKLAGEKFSQSYSRNTPMEVVVVRPFNFYSPRADPQSPYSGVITKFVSRLRSGQAPIIEGDGRQTRDFIHARDVARMIHFVLEKRIEPGAVFNCGSGHSTSILELASTAIAASGKPLKPEFTVRRPGDIDDSLADTTRAGGMLGFRPKVTLEEGLAELLR